MTVVHTCAYNSDLCASLCCLPASQDAVQGDCGNPNDCYNGYDCLSPQAPKCQCGCPGPGGALYGCAACTYSNGAFLTFYCGTDSTNTCQNGQNCNFGDHPNNPCPVMDEVYSGNIQVYRILGFIRVWVPV